jgi:hypothetical protein
MLLVAMVQCGNCTDMVRADPSRWRSGSILPEYGVQQHLPFSALHGVVGRFHTFCRLWSALRPWHYPSISATSAAGNQWWPTLRWIFQCFEGISLFTFPQPGGPPQQAVTELEPLHGQVLALLGPSYEKLYKLK